MIKKVVTTIAATAFLGACASSSSEIAPTYISPLQYQSYDCEQLQMEYMRVQRRASAVFADQDSEAEGDAVAMGVGLIIFWPALFFLIGDDQKEEVARLKGEIEAIEQAAISKKCTGLSQQLETDRERAQQPAANEEQPQKSHDARGR